ncbi:MAG: PAS domain S-box protein [Rhodocyclales bacterium GT-UBC]|nr:MAG: PAS domain S-box protein [Rhodocyclales bacterium GT-UBC]
MSRTHHPDHRLRARSLPWLCLAAALLATLFPSLLQAAPMRHILVISAYHNGLPWTDGQLAGLRHGLASANLPLELHVEFLDTKRFPPNATYLARTAALLKEKYENVRFDLVIAQDDDALDFALHERQSGHFLEGLPIVFSGVAGQRAATLKRESALTGTFDDADIRSNIDLLLTLRPELKKVVFIHDQSRAGLSQAEGVGALKAVFPQLTFEFLTALPVSVIQQRLHALTSDSAVILLTFNRDSEDRVLSHAEASQHWAEAAAVPILAKEDGMLVPGILGGIVVSSQAQGWQAAEAALRVLAGEDPKNIPLANGRTSTVFDFEQLQRFGIDPEALPAGAEIRNRPLSLREAYPREFWLTVSLFGCLAWIIVLQLIFHQRTRRARNALASSEQNYREILGATHDAIFIQGIDGEILEVNDGVCRLYGYSSEEVKQLTVARLSSNVPPFTQSDAERHFAEVRKKGAAVFEWQSRHKDGSLFWVEVALRQAQIGGQPRLIAAVRDIDQRRRAEIALRASEERYRLLLSHSPVGIVHFDLQLNITYANERFAEILQVDQEKLLGVDMNQLRDQAPLAACRQATQGEQGYFEGEYRSMLSGHTCWISFRTAPALDSDNRVMGGIGIVEDISSRVAAQQAVLKLNEELEKRVASRTNELVQANAEIKQAMKQLAQSERLAALGSLVAGVAHELNTPLGNANTVASSLRSRVAHLQSNFTDGILKRSLLENFIKESSDATALIERNIERAAELIQNFKQVAVDQTSIRRRQFDLAVATGELLATLRPRLKQTSHHLIVDIPPGILLDSFPGPLDQIITNFVINSLTHAFPPERSGTLSLAARQEGELVRIDYRDDGRGMTEQEASRAFDPFFTTRLGAGGSGLGLYITHNLATDVLGGHLTLDTAPGQGVHFSLLLPLQAPRKASETATAHTTVQ